MIVSRKEMLEIEQKSGLSSFDLINLVGKKLIEDSNNLKFDELKTICNKIARNLET